MAEKAKLILEFDGKNFNLLDEADKKLGTLEKRGKSTGESLAKSFVVLGAAFAGVSAAIGKSVADFSASEQSAAKLAQALKNTGNYSAAAMADLNAYAGALQSTTKFEDDSIISAQSLIAAQGYHGKVLKDITAATLDLAAAKGMDLAAAADIVSKSIGTENNVLARYGIEITGAADSTDRAYSAVKAISELYGGQAAAAGRTYEGQMASLKNQIGDVSEEIGAIFAPILLEITRIFKDGVVAVGKFVSEHKGLVAVVAGIVVAFTGLGAAIAGVMLAMPVLGAAFAILIGPVGWVVGGIVAIIAIIQNWGAVSTWLKDVWANAITALATLWDNFKTYLSEKLNALIENLKLFGQIAWDILTGKWKEALDLSKEYVLKYAEEQRATWEGMFSAIAGGIQGFAAGTVDVYQNIEAKIKDIVSRISSSWKNGMAANTKATGDEGNKQKNIWDEIYKHRETIETNYATFKTNITAALNSDFIKGSRDAFNTFKAVALANAMISMYQGAIQAYTSLSSILVVGPYLGGIAAAAAIAAGLANITQIQSVQLPAAEFGGIIPGSASGTRLIAGERGKSEAIIPLEGEGASRLRDSMGGGGGNTIAVIIKNFFADDDTMPKKIMQIIDEGMDELRQGKSSVFAKGLETQFTV